MIEQIPNSPVNFGLTDLACEDDAAYYQPVQEGDCTSFQLKQDICKTTILDTEFDCNDDTGWTLGTGWTIFNNKLIASLPTGNATYAGAFSIGSTYLIEFKYKAIISASVSIGDGTLFPSDAAGSKPQGDKFLIRATTTDFVITPNAAAKGFFSYIRIYEVPSNLVTDPNFFEPLSSGTTDATTASKLEDSTADFVTDGIEAQMIVVNTTDGTYTIVTVVDDLNTLTLADDIFVAGEDYKIYKWETNGITGAWQIPGTSAGGATHTSGTDGIFISAGLQPSLYYKFIFRISNMTAGSVVIRNEVCAVATISDTFYANGHYEVILKMEDCATPAPSDYLIFVPSTDFDGTILYAGAFEMCDIVFGSGLIPDGDSQFNTPLASGTTTASGLGSNILNDSGAMFFVTVGTGFREIVMNTTTGQNAKVDILGVQTQNDILTADGDIFDINQDYQVWKWRNFSSEECPITGGKLNFTPTGGSFSVTLEVSGFVQNMIYKVVFTISDRTAGSLNVQLGSNAHADSFSENKQHVIFIKYTGATGANNVEFFQGVPSTFDGAIDNVQIYPASFWVETEAGVFVDGIADVAVNPNGDKLAVTVNQNWDGYADGCYVIKGEDCCEGSEEITSNLFTVRSSQANTLALSWTNNKNAFGFNYETGLTHFLRLPSEVRQFKSEDDNENYKDSNAEYSKSYWQGDESIDLIVNDVPEWVHKALWLGLGHDHFYVNGTEYVNSDSEYEPIYRKTSRRAPKVVTLKPKTQVSSNKGT